MQTVYEQLQEQVDRVAGLRREHAATCATLAEKQAAFDAENAALLTMRTDLDEAIQRAEHALKTLTVSHFEMTGEAKPAAGVEVKLFTTIEYDSNRATEWAREKNLALTPARLDVKAFEKIVQAMPEKPDFVTLRQIPRAQIAGDLDKALGRRGSAERL